MNIAEQLAHEIIKDKVTFRGSDEYNQMIAWMKENYRSGSYVLSDETRDIWREKFNDVKNVLLEDGFKIERSNFPITCINWSYMVLDMVYNI